MKGYLKVRNGTYYAVISYKDSLGNWKQRAISTGLKERGNRKNAKAILDKELEIRYKDEDLKEWLEE